MSYEKAIQAAGANVIDQKYAGSYQGTFGVIVDYNGRRGLIVGSFGSCSYCDAFEREFSSYYLDEENTEEYHNKLAAFGKNYLTNIQDKWDVQNQINHLSDDDWYDEELMTILTWAIPYLE